MKADDVSNVGGWDWWSWLTAGFLSCRLGTPAVAGGRTGILGFSSTSTENVRDERTSAGVKPIDFTKSKRTQTAFQILGVGDPLLDHGFPFPPPPSPVLQPDARGAAGQDISLPAPNLPNAADTDGDRQRESRRQEKQREKDEEEEARLRRVEEKRIKEDQEEEARLRRVEEKRIKKKDGAEKAALYQEQHPRRGELNEDDLNLEDIQTQCPMIQVAGPRGPLFVYRPWTISEMKEISKDHLPNVELGGAKFSTALEMFCRQFSPTMPEIKKLLTLKMGPTHVSHFTQLLGGQQRMAETEWEHNDNAAYRDALTTLQAAITEKFPAKVDMSRIYACKQNADETVNDYFHRLEQVFVENSGLIKQEGGLAPALGVWETHLSNAFLNGLSPAISASVRSSCIGVMDGARLEEIRRHAVHAEKHLSEERASEEKKRRDRKEKAQLTMVQAVTTAWSNQTNPGQSDGQDRGKQGGRDGYRGRGGKGKGRGRGRRPNRYGDDQCFNCGEKTHWREDCPHEKRENNFQTKQMDRNKDNSSN
ncbi:uncharacterized protein LOC117560601 [Gymnodraco acuticeps]|uniref:Uncharacterized protein LOC117560601 n=1 Tax=Gymnodraco acuticeps TaxID=8218 RepID=A0A6P8W745_GYMAC|nr:uncharacterized protein LOC117560601 [Gymnodraco acuticeps]